MCLFWIREKSHRANVLFFFSVFAHYPGNCSPAKYTALSTHKQLLRIWTFMDENVYLLYFLLLFLFLVFHSRGRYITFDAVKLESIFHCTRIYFMVLFSRSALNQFYQWMSPKREMGRELKEKKIPHQLNTFFSSSTHSEH